MDLSALLTKMAIFMILLVIGYMGARKGPLNQDFSKAASWLLLNVFIVASIGNSVIGERPEISTGEFWKAFLLLWVMSFLIYAIAALCALAVHGNKNAPQIEMLMAVANNLLIGLPVAQSLFGSEAVFYMGISCVPYNLLLFTYGAYRLKKGESSHKMSFKDLLSAPLVAAIVSLGIFLVNPPVPKFIRELFSNVSAATSPLSMLIIGATLGREKLSGAFRERAPYLISLERLILAPLIVFFIMRGMTDNICLLMTCTIVAGCPTAAIMTPISIRYGHSPEYSSRTIMVSTAFSMITLPLLIKILM